MAQYKESKGTWMFRVYVKTNGINKQYTRKGFATKAEAREREHIFVASFEKQVKVKLTINECILSYKEYIRKRFKTSTCESKCYILDELQAYFDGLNMEQISISDINKFQDDQITKKISNQRINKKIQVFRDLMNYSNNMFDTNNTTFNKVVNLKEQKITRTDKHIEENIFNQFLNTFDDLETKVLFELMYKAGLRIAEAQALTWNDIDFVNRTISVNKQYFCATGSKYTLELPKSQCSIRKVDICQSLYEDLLELNFDKQSPYFKNEWFIVRDTKPIPDQTVNNIRRKHCAMIGVYFDNHSCRHSYGSNLIAKGFDIKYVSEQLGHESLGVTLKVYHHLLDSVRSTEKEKLQEL